MRGFSWEGEVSSERWMNFYSKILSKYYNNDTLKVIVKFKVDFEDSEILEKQIEEVKYALRESGLNDNIIQGLHRAIEIQSMDSGGCGMASQENPC